MNSDQKNAILAAFEFALSIRTDPAEIEHFTAADIISQYSDTAAEFLDQGGL